MNFILAFTISSLSKYFLMLAIFLSPSNSGIKQTSKGLILDSPSFVIISKGIYFSIKSNGLLPFKLSLNKLLI